jgi:hypothetical protein
VETLPREVCLDPRLLYNCTAPRFAAELPEHHRRVENRDVRVGPDLDAPLVLRLRDTRFQNLSRDERQLADRVGQGEFPVPNVSPQDARKRSRRAWVRGRFGLTCSYFVLGVTPNSLLTVASNFSRSPTTHRL